MVRLERRRIGATPLRATVMGLGTGGFSRAGLDRGEDHAAGIVAMVVESGIDFIDTAEGYGTEAAVAAGLRQADVDPRTVTVATKYVHGVGERVRTPAEVEALVHERLAALQRDHLDLLQVHAVTPDRYTLVRDTQLPVLEKLRVNGLITSIGITEAFTQDLSHDVLATAIADGCWDTVMVGYNLLNPGARDRVIEPAAAVGIGVLVMFAVREALVDFQRLRAYLAANPAQVPVDVSERVRRLEDLVTNEGGTLSDLAYRFAASTPGTSTVLVGTGNPVHLAQNRAALERGPLGDGVMAEVGSLFADVGILTGQISSQLPR